MGSHRPAVSRPGDRGYDPVMHASREDLHERDFYAWTRRQVAALRRWAATRPNLDLDLAHIAEEIAYLGKEQCYALRNWTVRIQRIPAAPARLAAEPRRHWTHEVINFRAGSQPA